MSSNNDTHSTALERLLNRTWSLVGEPIIEKFEELGLIGSEASSTCRVWWCLTGSLAFLPIHASFPSTKSARGMMDIAVSSYTPTISALLRAQERNKHSTFQMLVVGQANALNTVPLPGVKKEIQVIRNLLTPLQAKFQVLEDSDANVEGVAGALPACSWAHFACHGVQEADKPMDSGLVMWNGNRLTLSKVAQSSLASPQFALLSSCETATGSKQFPNEAVHLAAGLQFVGFRGVIGTMWSVGDEHALSVATQVYEELFKDGAAKASASEAALALHRAVLHLRGHVPVARWVPFVHFGL